MAQDPMWKVEEDGGFWYLIDPNGDVKDEGTKAFLEQTAERNNKQHAKKLRIEKKQKKDKPPKDNVAPGQQTLFAVEGFEPGADMPEAS